MTRIRKLLALSVFVAFAAWAYHFLGFVQSLQKSLIGFSQTHDHPGSPEAIAAPDDVKSPAVSVERPDLFEDVLSSEKDLTRLSYVRLSDDDRRQVEATQEDAEILDMPQVKVDAPPPPLSGDVNGSRPPRIEEY